MKIEKCKRNNLCIDCDDKECLHRGQIIADCPRHDCDVPPNVCENCEFIKRYQDNYRNLLNSIEKEWRNEKGMNKSDLKAVFINAKLAEARAAAWQQPDYNDGFMNIPDGVDDELPFN